ncbi:MAG: hypothetical protein L6R35_005075 [Caloplaca aegaea]|nr:MAG: hypothetical protein L6R35_005075 [Caloplaca aegaea]
MGRDLQQCRHFAGSWYGDRLEPNVSDATQDMWFDDYHAFDNFREQHWERYQKAPYLTPPARVAWDFGKSIAKSDRDEAARKVQIFRAWFRAQFFQDSQPLSIMPIQNTVPRYRDDPPE